MSFVFLSTLVADTFSFSNLVNGLIEQGLLEQNPNDAALAGVSTVW